MARSFRGFLNRVKGKESPDSDFEIKDGKIIQRSAGDQPPTATVIPKPIPVRREAVQKEPRRVSPQSNQRAAAGVPRHIVSESAPSNPKPIPRRRDPEPTPPPLSIPLQLRREPEPVPIDAPPSRTASAQRREPEPEPENETTHGRLPNIKAFWEHLKIDHAELTVQEYKWDYGVWSRYADSLKKKPYYLTYKDMESFLKDKGPSTYRRKVSMIKALGRWYNRAGKPRLLSEATKITTPRMKERVPGDLGTETFLEFRKLAQDWCAFNDRKGIWLGLMLLCGLRISEIQTVQPKGKHIKVVGKGSKERLIPCNEWLLIALASNRKDGRNGWAQKRKMIWAELAKEGIRHPHTLRHTYASEAMRRGIPIEKIQVLLGHANFATTSIYARATIPDEVADLMDA